MSYAITHVRTEQPYGHSYPHISHVRLSSGVTETREQVIYYIEQLRMSYVTQAPGYPPARVVVGDCPECGSGDYITTAPDYTTENNLLSLPRF